MLAASLFGMGRRRDGRDWHSAHPHTVLVDEPKPNWVRFVDRRLEAGPPKRDAPTLAFLVAGALAAALQDLNRVGFAMSATRPVCSQLLP